MRPCNLVEKANLARTRAGFTLIELLVAIAIISLIAAASLVALTGARGFGKSATAKARLDDVGQALELYKQKYGEYPPDCNASDAEIRRHILKRWPKALKGGQITQMVADAKAEMQRTPGSAALFWLAGFPKQVPVAGGGPDAWVYEGFANDPVNPFSLDPDESREEPLIELTYDSDGSGKGNYNAEGFSFDGRPMAYFRATNGGYEGKGFCAEGMSSEDVEARGDAVPYMNNGQWYNPKSFQLILPGEDGMFGFADDPAEHDHGDEEVLEPRDLGALDGTAPDWDNITNFTEGATLESEKE